MFLCYVDEAGDDGFPQMSSQIFVLTLLYMHHSEWKSNWERIRDFRRELQQRYDFPVKLEMHTKAFLTDKNRYRTFGFTPRQKRQILAAFLRLIAQLDIRVINITINKSRIAVPTYDVFDRALTYAIQRMENDLNKSFAAAKFMMISDEGRLAKMVSTARRMQRFNYISSMFGGSYRSDIKNMIEDPLSKRSEESWYIQLADIIVTATYYYKLYDLGLGHLPKRLEAVVKPHECERMLEMVGNRLNKDASRHCKFGIVTYPK